MKVLIYMKLIEYICIFFLKIETPWCTNPLEIEKDEKIFKEEGTINSKDDLLSWMHWMHCKSKLTVTSILQNVEYNTYWNIMHASTQFKSHLVDVVNKVYLAS